MNKSRQDYVLTAKAVAGFVFAIALFAASMYLSAAVGWEIVDFSDLRWWALVFVRIFLFAVLVMDVYPYLYQLIITDEYGVVHNRIKNYLECVEIVNRDHRMPDLDEALKRRNADEFRKEANAMLHRVSRRINYEDVDNEFSTEQDGKKIDGWAAITIDDIEKIIVSRCGIEKKEKKFKEMKKVFLDIKSGNVYVREIVADDLVDEGFIEDIEQDLAGKDIKKERNGRIAFTMIRGAVTIFLSATIVITSVVLNNAVFGVIIALAIIFGGILSGAILAFTLSTKIGYICDANVRLFRTYMNINPNVPIPEKPVKEKSERARYDYKNEEKREDILL